MPLKHPFKYSVLRRNNTEASTGGTDYFEVSKLIGKPNSKTTIANLGCGAKFPRNSNVLPHT